MRFFRGSKNKESAGQRTNPDLFDWWAATFTSEERNLILTKFQPAKFGAVIPISRDDLVRDDSMSLNKVINPDGSPAVKFSALAGWFSSPQHRHIARRILEKCEELSVGSVLDLHFTYSEMIPIYYRDRNTDPSAFEAAVAACEKQIELGPQAAAAFRAEYPSADLPSHRGLFW